MRRAALGAIGALVLVMLAMVAQMYLGIFSPESGEMVQLDELKSVESGTEDNTDSSTMPLLEIITSDGATIDKDREVVATLSVFQRENGELSDIPSYRSPIAIKYRGNSSYTTFDKLGYRLTLLQNTDKGVDSSRLDDSLLGMSAASDWVLNGPFLDRSFLRNRLMYSVSRELMDWAPNTRWCEVSVNGSYQGLYLLVEPVQAGIGRIGLTEFGLVSGETPYIVKRDRIGTETNVISTFGFTHGYTSQELSITYPSEQNLTEAQYSWIANDISAFEEVLYSDNFTDPNTGYAAYIDIDSFVDYFIINELAIIADASELSTFIYKDLGGLIKMAVWDFNNGFDNYPWSISPVDEFYVADANWFDRLLEDPAFVKKVCARWKELRQGTLSDRNLTTYIEEEYAKIEDAIDRNNEVWGYVYEEELLNDHGDSKLTRSEPTSPNEAVNMLKETLVARTAWLDEHLIDLMPE